jgi:hypothetical protein
VSLQAVRCVGFCYAAHALLDGNMPPAETWPSSWPADPRRKSAERCDSVRVRAKTSLPRQLCFDVLKIASRVTWSIRSAVMFVPPLAGRRVHDQARAGEPQPAARPDVRADVVRIGEVLSVGCGAPNGRWSVGS